MPPEPFLSRVRRRSAATCALYCSHRGPARRRPGLKRMTRAAAPQGSLGRPLPSPRSRGWEPLAEVGKGRGSGDAEERAEHHPPNLPTGRLRSHTPTAPEAQVQPPADVSRHFRAPIPRKGEGSQVLKLPPPTSLQDGATTRRRPHSGPYSGFPYPRSWPRAGSTQFAVPGPLRRPPLRKPPLLPRLSPCSPRAGSGWR